MILLYTAGPYRSAEGPWGVQKNINAAMLVAHKLWGMGYAVICPHGNTAHFDGPGYDDSDMWLEGDMEMIKVCPGIVMLPGWEDSEGSKQELATALRLGKQVYYWPAVPLAGFFGGGE